MSRSAAVEGIVAVGDVAAAAARSEGPVAVGDNRAGFGVVGAMVDSKGKMMLTSENAGFGSACNAAVVVAVVVVV